MGAISSPTFLDLAAAIDRRLNRNIQYPARTVGAGTTIVADTDRILLVDASAGAATLQLPSAAARKGMVFVAKKIDLSGNSVTILPAGSETIDGQPSLVLSTPQDSQVIASDGANWKRVSSLGKGGDIFAATRVVSQVPGEGTDTTIQSAVNNLPAEGGLVFIKQGTYNISSTIDLPSGKNIAFVGCGEATILQGGVGVALFRIVAGAPTRTIIFNNMTIKGTGSLGDMVVVSQSANYQFILLERCFLGLLGVFSGEFGSRPAFVRLAECIPPANGPFTMLGGFSSMAGGSQLEFVSSGLNFNQLVNLDAALIFCVDSAIGGDIGGEPIRAAAGSVFVGSAFTEVDLQLKGASVVDGCSFQNSRLTLDPGSNRSVVSGCRFSGPFSSGHSLVVNSSLNIISGVAFSGITQTISTGTVSGNVFDGINDYSGASISDNSFVEGSRTLFTSGDSQDAFVDVLTCENPVGVMFEGTVRNTGGVNSMEVQETAVDLFGSTGTQTTTVTPGNDLIVTSAQQVGAARPPYKSYKVSIRSTSPGASTTFLLRLLVRRPTAYNVAV